MGYKHCSYVSVVILIICCHFADNIGNLVLVVVILQ